MGHQHEGHVWKGRRQTHRSLGSQLIKALSVLPADEWEGNWTEGQGQSVSTVCTHKGTDISVFTHMLTRPHSRTHNPTTPIVTNKVHKHTVSHQETRGPQNAETLRHIDILRSTNTHTHSLRNTLLHPPAQLHGQKPYKHRHKPSHSCVCRCTTTRQTLSPLPNGFIYLLHPDGCSGPEAALSHSGVNPE